MPHRPRNKFASYRMRNRKAKLKREYGMTQQQFDAIFRTQGGKCAICRREIRTGKDTPMKEYACIDHDHATGKVRGLLCSGCNHGLGNFNDNPDQLRRAVTYLEYHRN